MFCRTLERGLSSTYVVQEIRHLLRTGVFDEELIFEVTKASAAEKERVAVQSKGKNTTGKYFAGRNQQGTIKSRRNSFKLFEL